MHALSKRRKSASISSRLYNSTIVEAAIDESTIVEAAIEAHDGYFTTAKILLDQLKSFVYVRMVDYTAISKMKKPEALEEAIRVKGFERRLGIPTRPADHQDFVDKVGAYASTVE